MTKTVDIEASVTAFGSIFSVLLELEGHEIDLHKDSNGDLVAELPQFVIEDNVNVFFQCKGINGAYCRLTINAKMLPKPVTAKRKVVVDKGVGRTELELTV